MSIRIMAVAGVSLMLASVAVGCSSPLPAPPGSGTVPAGTAQVTVDGQKLPPSDAVDCTFIESMTTIDAGDANVGATVVVDNAGKLKAKSVDLRDLSGFTGSFREDLGHEATVSMNGRTFTITGTADGFTADDPSMRKSKPFSMKVSC